MLIAEGDLRSAGTETPISMEKNLTNQCIALAGLSQAVYLVQQIAKRGSADPADMRVCIGSVLKVDAEDVDDVYGGLDGLKTGFRQLQRQLAEPRRVDPELARYASTLIFLERRFMSRPDMVRAIRSTVDQASVLLGASGDALNDACVEVLARGYQQTLSQLNPRVIVSGDQRYLADAGNANQIRALLMAGIRSVLLWRQAGGGRWKLLLMRSSLLREATRLWQRDSSAS